MQAREQEEAGVERSLLRQAEAEARNPLHPTPYTLRLGSNVRRIAWGCRSPTGRLVLESQLTHKLVNLWLTVTDQNVKLTILWGS